MADPFDHRPHVKGRRLNVLPDNPDSNNEEAPVELGRFPKWLHRKMPAQTTLWSTKDVMRTKRLATVCEEAKCPNLIECWSKRTATFLTMGHACTRNCGFCDIDFAAKPHALETDEPQRVADSVQELGLKHVVLTMVARDDLVDGGAAHLVEIIRAIRKQTPTVTIEVLTSDFAGRLESVDLVLQEQPEIFNHNLETVRSLTPRVRHKATYDRTLLVLQRAHDHGKTLVKSGIMVGLGETQQEVHATLDDLHQVGCHIVTIGHYLQPSHRKLRVKNFVSPEQFQAFADYGHGLGIHFVYSGPFIRSSYNAAAVFEQFAHK